MEDPDLSNHKALPCVVSWDLWITRNRILFQDQSYSLLEVFHSITYIYSDLKVYPKMRASTNSNPPEIDKSIAWRICDGVSQGNLIPCRAGEFFMFLTTLLFFQAKSG
jgi:hypothetical protein